MRLGVAGLMLPDVRSVTAEGVRRVRAAGFAGASCFFSDPLATTEAEVRRAAAVLRGEGVAPAQANARYERLCDRDQEVRRLAVRQAIAAVRCTAWLEAATLYIRPGGLNPRGHWLPHPENTHPATIQRLVESLRQVAGAAADAGVTLALEGHTVSPLDTPERTREVRNRVGSPALGFNIDPVNYVSGVADAYASTALLDRLFDCLGQYTVAGHAKDMRLEDRLVVHVAECIPGEGLLDQQTFLRRFQACCPNGWLLIEHLPDEHIPAARRAIVVAATAAGIDLGGS